MKDLNRIYQQQAGEPAAAAGDPPGDPPAGDPPAGDPPAGDPPAGDPPAGDPPKDPPADTWRTNLAGDNEDWSTRLERYTDQDKFVESAFQAHDKIRAGEMSTGLPEEPTEEQLNDYRIHNGIPLEAKEYDFSGADRELTEMDLEMLGPVSEIAHEHNISQEALVALMGSYMAETDKVVEQMHTQDNLDAQEFMKLAKENWGPEYTVNMNRANNQINLLPEAVRDSFKQARLPDGRGIMNSPEIMAWMVNIDRAITPMDPIKGGQEATLNDARKVVEAAKTRMRDDSVGWHKDNKAQAEYMQAQTMIDQFEGSQ